jgi:hypothetical protein
MQQQQQDGQQQRLNPTLLYQRTVVCATWESVQMWILANQNLLRRLKSNASSDSSSSRKNKVMTTSFPQGPLRKIPRTVKRSSMSSSTSRRGEDEEDKDAEAKADDEPDKVMAIGITED